MMKLILAVHACSCVRRHRPRARLSLRVRRSWGALQDLGLRSELLHQLVHALHLGAAGAHRRVLHGQVPAARAQQGGWHQSASIGNEATPPPLLPASGAGTHLSRGSTSMPRSARLNWSICLRLAFMSAGRGGYRGWLSRRSAVTTAGSLVFSVCRPPSISRVHTRPSSSTLISDANVACGQSSRPASSWPARSQARQQGLCCQRRLPAPHAPPQARTRLVGVVVDALLAQQHNVRRLLLHKVLKHLGHAQRLQLLVRAHVGGDVDAWWLGTAPA